MLPDIDESNAEKVDIKFAHKAQSCESVGGTIDFDPDFETDFKFKINSNCGVHLIDDKAVPEVIFFDFLNMKI